MGHCICSEKENMLIQACLRTQELREALPKVWAPGQHNHIELPDLESLLPTPVHKPPPEACMSQYPHSVRC